MGAASSSTPLLPSPHFHFSPPSAAVNPGKGKTPMRVGGWPAEARPRGVGSRSRRRKGKEVSAQEYWTRGRGGDVAARLWRVRPQSAWLRRAKGSFSFWEIPWRARARSGSASGTAGRAAVPSGARVGAVGRARAGGVENL
jgi:hypothetical protein